MINFVVCDDDERYLKMINKVITKYMMRNDYNYKIHRFNDYNDNFIDIVKSNLSFKIYVLDIEVPSKSGVDVAKIIRKYDINSIIIFLTGHEELAYKVLEEVVLFLTFINKFDDCENKFYKALDEAFRVLGSKKMIKIRSNGIIYNICVNDIVYIIRDSLSRKLVIKTDYCEYTIYKNLKEIKEMLGSDFIQTHRACIVNKKRIVSLDKGKRLITMDTNDIVDLVSTRFDWSSVE